MKVVGQAYLGLGALLVVMAALYWFTSYENAGAIMLLLAACLALLIGAYLAWAARQTTTEPADEADGPYLPHASAWPFFIGVAVLVTANGLALGLWALVPGAIGLVLALIGYAGQSRRRA
ncbi:MAG: cytochrome c oxidase subunit 4 [Acidimicrobiales bacterium]